MAVSFSLLWLQTVCLRECLRAHQWRPRSSGALRHRWLPRAPRQGGQPGLPDACSRTAPRGLARHLLLPRCQGIPRVALTSSRCNIPNTLLFLILLPFICVYVRMLRWLYTGCAGPKALHDKEACLNGAYVPEAKLAGRCRQR